MLYSGWFSSLGLVKHSNISIASFFNSASKSSSSFDDVVDDVDDKSNDDDGDNDFVIDDDVINDFRNIECFFIEYGNPYANDNITNIKPIFIILRTLNGNEHLL